MRILGFGEVGRGLSKVCQDHEVIINDNIIEIFSSPLDVHSDAMLSKSDKQYLSELNVRWLEDPTTCYDFGENIEFYFQKALDFLVEKKIDFIVQPSGVPHHLDTALIDIAGRFLKIKTVNIYLTCFEDGRYILFKQSTGLGTRVPLEVQSDLIVNDLEHLKSFKTPKINSNIDWYKTNYAVSLLRASYTGVRQFFLYRKNDLNSELSGKFSFFNHWRSIKKQTQYNYALKKSYSENIKFSSSPIIFYAHFQPEATTFPEGGDYSNQATALRAIRKNFPDSQVIYREHPGISLIWDFIIGMTRVGYCRSLAYLNLLKRLKVQFISDRDFLTNFEETKKIINVTICGTIAIQRSLNGYKTIVLGNPFYTGLPGTYSLETFKKEYLRDPTFFLAKDDKIGEKASKFLSEMQTKYCLDLDISLGRAHSNETGADNLVGFQNLLKAINKI